MGDVQAPCSHHLIRRKLVEDVVVAHPSDGETVVDVAGHAAEEKEWGRKPIIAQTLTERRNIQAVLPYSISAAVPLAHGP